MDCEVTLPLAKTDFIKSLSIQDRHFIFTTENHQMYISTGSSNQMIQFANPLYDQQIFENRLIVSQRDMPICLYQKQEDEWKSIARIHDVKQNTEKFQCPLQLIYRKQNSDIIGCGKGFIHSYDVSSLKIIDHSIIEPNEIASCMDTPQDNQNFSQTKQLLVVGYFNKVIKIFNLNDKVLISTIKIHIGGVTQVTFDKDNSLYFYSAARQDNLVYIWDIRNTTTFVGYYQRINATNQRVGFDIQNNLAVLGNDDGSAYIYQNGKVIPLLVNETNTCVHSSHIFDKKALFAYGERSYETITHNTGMKSVHLEL